jgi:hypothetical protein
MVSTRRSKDSGASSVVDSIEGKLFGVNTLIKKFRLARLLYTQICFEIFKIICCFLTHENMGINVNPET